MLSPRDVVPHLGKGEAHWRVGYSAHALATTWFAAGDLPPAVRAAFEQHPRFRRSQLVDAFFERQTDLRDGFGGPSQTDLLIVLQTEGGLAIIGVEGKVEESFGPLIGDQTHFTPNQRTRLEKLADLFGLAGRDLSHLRYQLFHRAAAAVCEADRYAAPTAVLLVHWFSKARTGFLDFTRFWCELTGETDVCEGALLGPARVLGIDLYAAWVADALPPTSDSAE